MRDDRPHRGFRTAATRFGAVVALMLAPGLASAQLASMQLDYQNLRVRGRVVRPDGSLVDTTFTRSFWVQTYRATATRRLRPTLDLLLQGEYSRQAYIGRDESTETPFGTMRLTNPVFGMTASYRPSRQVQQALPGGGGGGFIDTSATRRLDFRSRESIVTAYVVPQALPRLDLSWIRRSADATSFAPGSAQEQRSVRSAWGRNGLSLRAGYTDLARGVASTRTGSPIQRTYDAGAGYSKAFGPRVSTTFAYDFTRFHRDPPGGFDSRSDGHVATLGAAYRQARTFDWGLGYSMRYVDQDVFRRTITRDHEGSLTASWHPRPAYGAYVSSGIRTLRDRRGERLLRFVSGQATTQGVVRRGWTVTANAGESVNWDPETPAFSTSHVGLGSQMNVRRGLDLSGNYTATVSRDTSRSSGVTSAWSLGASLTPWRAFSGRASLSESRASSTLGIRGGASRSWLLNARWTPGRSVDMLGAVNRTDVLGDNGSSALSQSLALQWTVSQRLRTAATYARSSSDFTSAVVAAGSGRESVSLRADWALFEHGSVSLGYSAVEPGTSRETRQINASWNQRLWR